MDPNQPGTITDLTIPHQLSFEIRLERWFDRFPAIGTVKLSTQIILFAAVLFPQIIVEFHEE